MIATFNEQTRGCAMIATFNWTNRGCAMIATFKEQTEAYEPPLMTKPRLCYDCHL